MLRPPAMRLGLDPNSLILSETASARDGVSNVRMGSIARVTGSLSHPTSFGNFNSSDWNRAPVDSFGGQAAMSTSKQVLRTGRIASTSREAHAKSWTKRCAV